MKEQLLNLITLGFAKGYRTLLVCGVIVLLAALQHFGWITVPTDVWLALFGLAIACLRSGMPPAAALLLLCGVLTGGCRTVSVYEVPGGSPVTVNVDQSWRGDLLTGIDTNLVKAAAQGAAEGAK